MGVETSVCFCSSPVSCDVILDILSTEKIEHDLVYVVLGNGQQVSRGIPFVALWSSEPFNLTSLCRPLSLRIGCVCVCWKSDHGGVGGCQVFSAGMEVGHVQGTDYPAHIASGFRDCFGKEVSAKDRSFFPEIVLDSVVECWALRHPETVFRKQLTSEVTKLLENDLNVEPVFPLDV